jgi:hypothetical protein
VHFLFVSFQNNVSANGKVSCREMFGSFNIEVPVFLVPCMCYYVTGQMSMDIIILPSNIITYLLYVYSHVLHPRIGPVNDFLT